TRSPLVTWRGFAGLTALLWAPFLIFVIITIADLAVNRKSPRIAVIFAFTVFVITFLQVRAAHDQMFKIPVLWSNRVMHLASGVSPVLPFLLIFAAGYWWVWFSLRGLSIVDLRRPRLPNPCTLPEAAVRISDIEGEHVRDTAHPVKLAWRVLVVIAGLVIIA